MPDIHEIIDSHLPWVRSLALRQTRDPHLADDITQAVFLTLHRKRPHDNAQIRLVGWLFRTTQFLVRESIRKQIRRDYHEREAATLRGATMQGSDESANTATHIDAAIAELPVASRNLILLRFYRGLSFAQIAEQLGFSENAAKKRMGRVLDQLQPLLVRRGVAPTSDLAAVLALQSAAQSSAALKAAILAVASGTAPAGPAVVRMCKLVTRASLKPILIAAAAAILATAAGIALVIAAIGRPSTAPAPVAQAQAKLAAPVADVPPAPVQGANLVEYRLLLPDARPAANALVYVGTSGMTRLGLTDLAIAAPPEGATRYRADAEGRIRIPPLQARRDALLVLHTDGYMLESAQMLEAGNTQSLMPWGRIEGTLSDAAGPLAGRTVRVWSPIGYNSVSVDSNCAATTDASGRFSFDRVICGDMCRISVSGLPWSRDVQVLPGETLSLAITEGGSLVTATVDAPESPFFFDYPISFDVNGDKGKEMQGVQFYEWAGLTLDKRREFLRKAHDSGTWKRYVDTVNRNFGAGKSYSFACTYRNPSIRLPDLGPGTWHFGIKAQGYDTNRFTAMDLMDDALGIQYQDVTIAPGQKVVDLGRLSLRPVKHLLVGETLAPQRMTTLTKEPVDLPDANAAITLVMFLNAGSDPATPQKVFAEAEKQGDIEFIEVMLGDVSAGFLRHRQAQAHWPQVQMKYWGTEALRLELGISQYGTALMAFANDGTLLAREAGYGADVTKLLAKARERLSDPAKLKAAEAPKPNATPRDRLSKGVDSNRLVLPAPAVASAPALQASAQPAPTTGRVVHELDSSVVAAADTIRFSTKEGYRFVTDKRKGGVSWSKDGGRSVYEDGAWYAISKLGKAMRYPCTMPADGPHQQIAQLLKADALRGGAAAAPDHDKVVNGEKWFALQTGFLGYMFVDEKLRIREVSEMPFGPALPEDAAAWQLPADCLDLGKLAEAALTGRPADKSWDYEGKHYELYQVAGRKASSIIFAVVHSFAWIDVVSRGVYLEGATEIKRMDNRWLCMRIASLQSAPVQIDWYYATPATIAPELAGDLRFYMHPFSRPYRTKPDGTMVQDIAEPDPVCMPLPNRDFGPSSVQLANSIYSTLSAAKELPVKAMVISRYSPQAAAAGINDGSDLRSVSEMSLQEFVTRLMEATGEGGATN